MHPGWERFKALLLGPDNPEVGHLSLKSILSNKLMSEARAGETVKTAAFAAQIDILPIILAVPEKYLTKS